jgi:uncharacterized membrane protein
MERAARILIAITFAALGVHHFVYRNFVTRVMPKPPVWIPWQPFWAIVVGLALVGGAIGMAMGKRNAAVMVGCGCAASFLLFHLPRIFSTPFAAGGSLVGPGKGLVHAGTAFVVAASLSPRDTSGARERWILFGKYALAGFMILCGYLHFEVAVFVASLFPSWISWHYFWTSFAGVALIAGGIGIVIPRTTQLACLLSGIMILAWVPLIHIPLALKNLSDPGQSVPVCEATQFGAMAVLAWTLGQMSSRPVQGDSTARGEDLAQSVARC